MNIKWSKYRDQLVTEEVEMMYEKISQSLTENIMKFTLVMGDVRGYSTVTSVKTV